MREIKKQLEVLLINYFRDYYTEFPKGSIVPVESPDFVVKIPKKRRLGIELTRLSPNVPAYNSGSNISEIELRIIERSKELFERNNPHKLFVKVLFSGKYPAANATELPLAARLSAVMRNAIKSKNRSSFFSLTVGASQLPREIEQLLLVHHPKLETNVWEACNNLGLSENIINDIQLAIDKKEEKLHLYRRKKFNEYWLLISVDHLQGNHSYNIRDQLQYHNFKSGFNRVLLFDLLSARVFHLDQ